MSESFVIGTKFFRYIDSEVEIPDVIRLKKQEGDRLYFNDGGYVTNVFRYDLDLAVSRKQFIKEKNCYWRSFNYFGTPIKQKWMPITEDTPEAKYVGFKVDNIGLSMKLKELKDNYIRLIPDGFMTFSNITYSTPNNSNEYDVLITLHHKNEKIPYAICRQDVIDIFSFSNIDKTVPIGIAISQESCPKSMDFNDFMYSDKVYGFKAVSVYLDDSLNTILKYVGSTNKYNSTLQKLAEKYRNTNMRGYCKDVYSLMVTNGLYEEFKRLFDVRSFPFKLDPTRFELNEHETIIFNKLFGSTNKILTNISAIPYSKEYDVDKFKTKHVLVNTGDHAHSQIYIMLYTEVENLPG